MNGLAVPLDILLIVLFLTVWKSAGLSLGAFPAGTRNPAHGPGSGTPQPAAGGPVARAIALAGSWNRNRGLRNKTRRRASAVGCQQAFPFSRALAAGLRNFGPAKRSGRRVRRLAARHRGRLSRKRSAGKSKQALSAPTQSGAKSAEIT